MFFQEFVQYYVYINCVLGDLADRLRRSTAAFLSNKYLWVNSAGCLTERYRSKLFIIMKRFEGIISITKSNWHIFV